MSPTCGTWSIPSSSTNRAPGNRGGQFAVPSRWALPRLAMHHERRNANALRYVPQIGKLRHRLPGEQGHLRTHGSALQRTHPLSCRWRRHAGLGAAQSMVLPVAPVVDRSRSRFASETRLSGHALPESGDRTAPVPYRIKELTRSGYVAANNRLIGPPSENPNKAGRLLPAASMTASKSSARLSRWARRRPDPINPSRACRTGSPAQTTPVP